MKAKVVAVLSLLVVSCLCGCNGPCEEHNRLTMHVSHHDSRVVDDVYRWDVLIELDRVDFSRDYTWEDLEVSVQSRTNTRFDRLPIAPYDPGNPVGVVGGVFHQDTEGDPTMPNAGDRVWLLGLDRSHQSMAVTLGIVNDSRDRWTAPLPSMWRETIEVDIGDPAVMVQEPGRELWLATTSVLNVTPEWEALPWTDVHVALNRPSLGNDRPLDALEGYPNVGNLGDQYPDWHHLDIDGNGLVDAGDRVVVENLTTVYEATGDHLGTRLLLVTGRVVVGSARLPGEFPDPTIHVDLSGWNVTLRRESDPKVYDLVTTVLDVRPPGTELEWEGASLSIYETDGNYSLLYCGTLSRLHEKADDVRGAYYEDAMGADGVVGDGDQVLIFGLSEDHEGGLCRIDFATMNIKSDLPTSFA